MASMTALFRQSFDRGERRRLAGFFGGVGAAARCGLGALAVLRRRPPDDPGAGRPRLHVRAAARVRRRPHRGHRQHHPQAAPGRAQAGRRRLLLLARPLVGRLPDRGGAGPRGQVDRRRRRRATGESCGSSAAWSARPRLGRVPRGHRTHEPRDPARHRSRLPAHEGRRVRPRTRWSTSSPPAAS